MTDRSPEEARRDCLKGHVDFQKELIMVRPYTMLGRGADPTQFEVLVLRKGNVFDKDGEERSFKLRADTAESAAVWVETLTNYCRDATVTLIEGEIKKIEIIGERTLNERGPKLGTCHLFVPLTQRTHSILTQSYISNSNVTLENTIGTYTSYTIRVTKRDDTWFERSHRFSNFKRLLRPRLECLLSSKGIDEKRSIPKFPGDHVLSNMFGGSEDVVQTRISELQVYVDEIMDLSRRQPNEKFWWCMRLLVQFFAPVGSEIPLLRRLRKLVEKESMSDYAKVKRILINEFGADTYQKYRKEVQKELKKQFRTDYVPEDAGTYGSSTSEIEDAEKKLAVLDYVSNPFKIVGTLGSIPDAMLAGSQGSKLKELAECKFHGTLMKTNSKFKEWERRWCRIPKEGGVMRRSVCSPFFNPLSPIQSSFSFSINQHTHTPNNHTGKQPVPPVLPGFHEKNQGNSTQECDRDDGSNTLERGSQEERQGRTSQVASHSVLVQTRSTGQKGGKQCLVLLHVVQDETTSMGSNSTA